MIQPDAPKSEFSVTYLTPTDAGTDADAGGGTGQANIRAEGQLLDLRDGCEILRVAEGRLEIRDSEGRSATVDIEDYRRDSRPLHWLREYGKGSL